MSIVRWTSDNLVVNRKTFCKSGPRSVQRIATSPEKVSYSHRYCVVSVGRATNGLDHRRCYIGPTFSLLLCAVLLIYDNWTYCSHGVSPVARWCDIVATRKISCPRIVNARTIAHGHWNFRRPAGARFTKYLTTILRLSYDNAKVTIDLRRTSNLQNVLRRTQGFSEARFACKVVGSSETVFAN